ncbi:MAG: hypothetical protein ABGZ17_08205, partial [Planctomycetaceae bacterium]
VCLTVGNLRLLSEQRLSIVLTQFAAIQFGILLCGLAMMAWVTAQSSGESLEIQQRHDSIGVVLSALATAAFSLTGTMAILVYLRGRHAGDVGNATVVHVAELSGLAYRRPLAAICLSACLMTLGGWPLMPGFWVRFRLLVALQPLLLESPKVLMLGLLILANLAVTAVLSGKLLITMFVNRPWGRLSVGGARPAICSGVFVALLLLCGGLAPRLLTQWTQPIASDARTSVPETALPADRLP